MKINGSITILCDDEGVRIEIHDEDSRVDFIEINMTPAQFTSALGRSANTKCASMEVKGLDRVGKIMEMQNLAFEIPKNIHYDKREKRNSALAVLADKACPEGWISDSYFDSQDSFFFKGGKGYARTVIRRWVDKKEE